MKIQLVIFQFEPIWQNIDASLASLTEQFAKHFSTRVKARNSSPCLVVLPELFASGFSMKPEKFAQGDNGVISRQLAKLARLYHLEIIAGVAQKQNHEYRNCALWFDVNGDLKVAYQKQKLFRFANEHKVYRPGESSVSASLFGFLESSLFICYDLRFPELFRKVAKQTQIAVIVANWPQSRQMHWQVLLQARAIENQMWVLGVNRIGSDGNGLAYAGGSMLFNPKGELIFDAKTSPVFEYELELDQMRKEVTNYRQSFPALEDM